MKALEKAVADYVAGSKRSVPILGPGAQRALARQADKWRANAELYAATPYDAEPSRQVRRRRALKLKKRRRSEARALKPHTPDQHIIKVVKARLGPASYKFSLHATKGWRKRRRPEAEVAAEAAEAAAAALAVVAA
jgi:hypothetical protein